MIKKSEKNIIQPEGNYYDKYRSRNPIVRWLMYGFFKSLDNMLDIIPIYPEKILEAGCGEGTIAGFIWKKYEKYNIQICAFDISEKIINLAQKNNSTIYFFKHNIYEPLPKNNRYELIVCSEVLEHLEHPKQAIKNLMQYSSDFIFSVPQEPIWRILNIARGRYLKSFGNTPGHIKHYSKRSFQKMLEECGLEIIRMDAPLPWLMVYCHTVF